MNYNFYINDFEGPLDLLLHLIKCSKMDIYEVNITKIIDQYLEYIHQMEDLNIDVASEYLVMAAELIHLKSKLIINIKDEEDEDDYSINSEEDLKERLLNYQKFKDVSENFKELEEKRKEVYTKIPESLKEYMEEGTVLNSDLTVNDLLNAFLKFQERVNAEKPLQTKVTKKEISIDQKVSSIRDILKLKSKVNFIELFEEVTKPYVVITLLSVLQMSKNNEINLIQEENMGEIFIEAR